MYANGKGLALDVCPCPICKTIPVEVIPSDHDGHGGDENPPSELEGRAASSGCTDEDMLIDSFGVGGDGDHVGGGGGDDNRGDDDNEPVSSLAVKALGAPKAPPKKRSRAPSKKGCPATVKACPPTQKARAPPTKAVSQPEAEGFAMAPVTRAAAFAKFFGCAPIAAGNTATAEGTSVPVMGKAATANDNSAPPKGKSAPPKGKSAPPKGKSAPPKGKSAPPKGKEAPATGNAGGADGTVTTSPKAKAATPPPAQDTQGASGMNAVAVVSMVQCTTCKCFEHFSKCRVWGKSDNPSWKCSVCNSKHTTLNRKFGSWPLPSFKKLSPEEQARFWQDIKVLNADEMATKAEELMMRYEVEEQEWMNGGVFWPLSKWEKEGFNPETIQQNCKPEDVKWHTVLQENTYRVALVSTFAKHTSGQRREQTSRTKLPKASGSGSGAQVASTEPEQETRPEMSGDDDSSSSSSTSESSSSSSHGKKRKKHKKGKDKKGKDKKGKDKKKDKKGKKDRKDKKDNTDKETPQQKKARIQLDAATDAAKKKQEEACMKAAGNVLTKIKPAMTLLDLMVGRNTFDVLPNMLKATGSAFSQVGRV